MEENSERGGERPTTLKQIPEMEQGGSGFLRTVLGAAAALITTSGARRVLAAQAAHWFDLPVFYAEAARVGRPGALLALVSYGPILGEGDVGAALADIYHGPIHDHWPAERAHVEDGYVGMERAGVDDVRALLEEIDTLHP